MGLGLGDTVYLRTGDVVAPGVLQSWSMWVEFVFAPISRGL